MTQDKRWTFRQCVAARACDTDIEHKISEQPMGELVAVSLTVLHGSGRQNLYLVDEEGVVLGRADDATVRLTEPMVSRTHARISWRDGQFWIEDLGSSNGTFIDEMAITDAVRLPRTCLVRLGSTALLQCVQLDERGARSIQQLHKELFVDSLTEAGNRRLLKHRLREEVSYARRREQMIGLLLADLDHFKRVNDEHGHLTGDRLLAEIGRILRETSRGEDSVFRFGGEEFCVLVRDGTCEGLMRLAERIRVAVEGFEMTASTGTVRITVSLGAAVYSPSEIRERATLVDFGPDEPEDGDILINSVLLSRADQALYEAKATGRNRVVFFG
jgi:two-component system, cell cycle response regulator